MVAVMKPGWECLRLFILMGWITVMLYICASQFDATELKAIAGIAAGIGGFKAVEWARLKWGG